MANRVMIMNGYSRQQASAVGLYVLAALVALTVGALVYVLDRPPTRVYFLPEAWSLAEPPKRWFGVLGNHIPEFVHVYAFILLTAAVIPWRRHVLPVCGFWLVIDALFEIGQHPQLAPSIALLVPSWFQQVPLLEATAGYFRHGVFDPWDLLAIVAGTGAAYLTMLAIASQKKAAELTRQP